MKANVESGGPLKVKQFMWRLLNNTLSVRVKLQEGGMDIRTQCPKCDKKETLYHVFF